MFRKFKWFTWINRKRSEDNMLNRFDKKFGGPKRNIICIGDFEQKKTLKYREPTKGKSFRKLFKNRGYKVYLVDEFRTSCRSFIDGSEMETFKMIPNPKPYKDDTRKCHGLLRKKSFRSSAKLRI